MLVVLEKSIPRVLALSAVARRPPPVPGSSSPIASCATHVAPDATQVACNAARLKLQPDCSVSELINDRLSRNVAAPVSSAA